MIQRSVVTKRVLAIRSPFRFGVGWDRRTSKAFTLIELLVGLVVLALLTTLLTSVFSNFSKVTSDSNHRVEMSKQTRRVFDLMAFDIGSAVKAGGVNLEFRKDEMLPDGTVSKNDALMMLANAKTRDSQSRMAKIGYGVAPYQDKARNLTLQTILRYVEPFAWGDDTTSISVTSAADAQSLAPGILRLELSFVTRDGSILSAPPSGNQALEDFYKNLTAVVCTVATLDENSLQKLTQAQRDEISDRLADAVDGQTPLPFWQATDFSDLPKPVGQGLRFHQRNFQLN